MHGIKTRLNDLAWRKRATMIISGAAILIALFSKYMLDSIPPHNVFMALAAIVAGVDIAIRAISALRCTQITIELLVTIAAAGALIIGEYWEAAAVTFLFVFGAWLEARTVSRTRASLAGLIELAPSTAMVMVHGTPRETALEDVEIGDLVLVRPGENIPVDGEVVTGTALVNEAPITGESMPVTKTSGEPVFTGTILQDAALTVRTTGVGADSMLGRIIERVEEAQDAKAPVQTTIEKFARWYTPAIIVLAGVIWLFMRDTHLALTILVIGCPGALVIATPVAFVAGIGRAASLGILIKGGEFLEQVAHVTALGLDKTGTLTEGRPTLTDIIPAHGASEEDVLRMAAVAERGSAHPLAQPIVAAADARSLNGMEADQHSAIVGQGVTAQWQGETIGVGTRDLMDSLNVTVPDSVTKRMNALQADGKTVVLVSAKTKLLGLLAVEDQVRDGIETLVPELKEVGVSRVAMLTGDTAESAHAIAGEVGIDEVLPRSLPEDKLAWISNAQHGGGVVAMVGDGINDAPALAAADVSIAMGAAGTDVALETANIALMNDDPMRIVDALRISRKTGAVIRQNLVVAIGTVALLLAGVLLRQVNMAGGMLVHEASVMIVILNGMRLMRA